MKIKNSILLKFIKKGLDLAKSIPRHFSKFSNKIFCNHQKMILLVLKQKLRTTYRDLIEILKISDIPMYIGLKRIPHHTTLIKFSKKIKSGLLNLLLPYRKAKHVAVDATGFELDKKSYYYRNIYNSNRRQKTKRYMKLSLSVDTDKHLILRHKIRKKFRNDTLDFISVTREIKAEKIFADKGYDSKKNRQFVLNKLKAIPVIPVRMHTNFYGRLKQGKKIDGSDYHQRSKVETVFSMIKKRYGSVLLAKSDSAQKVELITKLIAHNIDRAILFSMCYLLRVSAQPY
jgi:IS5 family transposase